MDFFNRNGIVPYINAHDTYTVYGGSRMAENTLMAMKESAAHFVDMEQMQRELGSRAARMTHNEGAFFTNGAAGGLLLAACVCMVKGNPYLYRKLPETKGTANEIIMLRCQRNAYDAAVAASGADIVEIGDADETLAFELEGRINEKTAAVFYFVSTLYKRGSLPLEEVIRIAHKHKVPVVVDAAAQLPPAENLWRYTQMGAELVIFSGGKSLCGPQDSGLIVGKKEWIEDCIRFGAPEHGICRASKTSREAMGGLFTALSNYMERDGEEERIRLLMINRRIEERIKGLPPVQETEMVPYGPVGQGYPRLFCYLKQEKSAEEVVKEMKKRRIYIGLNKETNAIYISPLNLMEEEAEAVAAALYELLKK